MTRIVEVYKRYDVSKKVRPDKEMGLISISTQGIYYDEMPINTEGWADVIEMEFDDVERESFQYKPITYSEAAELLKFIYKNKDKDIIVHCDAGISRSVAVALFLKTYFDYDVLFFGGAKDFQYYNKTVFERLKTLHNRTKEKSF